MPDPSKSAQALDMTLSADADDLVLADVHAFLERELSYDEVNNLAVAAHSLWRACREVSRRRSVRDHARDNRARWRDLDARH